MQDTWIQSLGWEDPLEKRMTTHTSILAWRNPWTEEPGGIQSMGHKELGHNWVNNYLHENLQDETSKCGLLSEFRRIVWSPSFRGGEHITFKHMQYTAHTSLALRLDHAWHVWGIARGSVWLEESEWGNEWRIRSWEGVRTWPLKGLRFELWVRWEPSVGFE